MEGRWAVLTVRAARLGALDFSKVTRDEPRTLRVERLYLDDIEREMCAKFYMALSAIEDDRVKRTSHMLEALGSEMPWLGAKPLTPEMVQRSLEEKWRQHQENKDRKKKEKKTK